MTNNSVSVSKLVTGRFWQTERRVLSKRINKGYEWELEFHFRTNAFRESVKCIFSHIK